jgi:hypothetical protein
MRRRAVAALVIAGALGAGASPAVAAGNDPGDTPAAPVVSNMGLCSAFLGQLGVRDFVNHLIKSGVFEVDTPGELYRIRAREHPGRPAEVECLAR